jgi:hypothetical protein
MISESYKELNRQLHEQNLYGVSGWFTRDIVRQISDSGRLPILDYGCGKRTLSKALGPAYRVTDYDPCIEGLDTPPEPHPIVVCGDVLEHVEPEFVDDVLKDLRRLCTDVGFFVITFEESSRILPDGRNAHLSQHPIDWWLNKLAEAKFTVLDRKSPEKTVRTCWFIVQ